MKNEERLFERHARCRATLQPLLYQGVKVYRYRQEDCLAVFLYQQSLDEAEAVLGFFKLLTVCYVISF